MGNRSREGGGASLRVWVGALLCMCVLGTRADPGTSLAAAGERLFADPELSLDGTVSCVSCHRPLYAFADPRPQSKGVGGLAGTRNAPSLLDAGRRPALTWDGRTPTLKDQVLVAFTHPREHALPSVSELETRLAANAVYRDAGIVTLASAQAALVVFVTGLRTGTSAYDRWRAGDAQALSPPAVRGLEVFAGRAGCAECHRLDATPATFSDGGYHRIGIGLDRIAPKLKALTEQVERASADALEALIATDASVAALGRYLVTRDPQDIGRYRTPSLRNVAVTAPYFHDGSIASLEDAVAQEIYYRAQERGRVLPLNSEDRSDLIEFLRALTDAPYERQLAPAAPPAKGK